jgi:endoglucanase
MKHTLTFLLLNLMLCFCIQGQIFNYAEALQKSLYFYDANKCGVDVAGGKLTWRGDCHVTDAVMPLNSEKTNMSDAFISAHIDILDPDGDGTIDLAGGYHDAGDHVQFGLPQTYSSSTIEWAMYEFKDAFIQIGEYDHMMDILRWASDYYLKCTYRDASGEVIAFCYQTGEGSIDHNLWAPPELVPIEEIPRAAYFATTEAPASDQCAGAAASLALSYLNNSDDDPAYAAECLDAAEALYAFAVENRGLGYDGGFYNSSFDEDEMAWAAIWLYIATGTESYLTDITSQDSEGMYTGWLGKIIRSSQDEWQNIWVHSWDTKWGGIFAKLAPITDDPFHWYIFRWNLEYWSGVEHEDGDGAYLVKTPGGFSYLTTWGSARYNAAAQFQGMVYKKYADDRFDAWMTDQMNYIMGDNPLGKSYIVGYSDNYAEHPHHRAAHGSPNNSMFDPPEHKHILWGALVGGPGPEDEHVDETNDFIYNEVAIDYNAGLVGALAGHVSYFGEGQEAVSPFPPADPELVEYTIEAKMHEENTERSQLSIQVRNESAFPPRREVDIRAQYFFNITELLEYDQTIDDVSFAVYYDENDVNGDPVSVTGPLPYDESNGIYYMELQWPESGFYGTREYQFGLLAGQDANYESHWDPTNDYSRQGIGEEYEGTTYVPMYADGELVVGALPDDDPINRAPSAVASADLLSGQPPLTVNFDGSASSDPDGDELTYAWDFGDGNSASTETASNIYAEEGTYLVSLTVSDSELEDVATLSITVGDAPVNTAPVAVLEATPVSGIVPLSVSFDASESSDAEGDALNFMWDFGDGETATGETVNHTYETTGNFTATVTVSDGALSDNASVSITVSEPTGEPTCDSPSAISLPFSNDGAGVFCWVTSGNIEYINSWGVDTLEINGVPIDNVWISNLPDRINGNYYIYMVASIAWAHVEIMGSGGDDPVIPVNAVISASPLSGEMPLEVTFSASGSTGEGILSYDWDLGDGTTASTETLANTYDEEGDYVVTLTVTDETGAVDQTSVTIEVSDGGEVQPPVAAVSASPTQGLVPLTVSFDAGNSTDPQGLALTYAWDFGDGTTDSGVQTEHIYTAEGTYTASVTVSNGSLTDVAEIVIVVEPDDCLENTAPVAVADASPQTGEAPLSVTLDGSASTDADGDVLTYEWEIDGNVYSGATVEVTLDEAGSYTAILTVTDACETTSTNNVTIEVAEGPDPVFCENPTSISIPFSQDGTGDYCWVTTTEIAYVNSWNLDMLLINGVDYTNTWSNNLPPAENGEWIIEYSSSVGWGHFEAPQAKNAEDEMNVEPMFSVFPNPFNSSINLSFKNMNVKSVEVLDMTGKLINVYIIEKGVNSLEFGEDLQTGMYMLKLTTDEGSETTTIRKK